jgi:hypothetical protein
MREALWLVQAAGFFCLLRTIALGHGWWMTADVVGDHVRSAFLSLLFCMGAHVGTPFYLIGTRKILRASPEQIGFQAHPELFQRSETIIRRATPAIAIAGVALMIGFILGGAADTGAISIPLHGVIATLAVLANAFALAMEAYATAVNFRILRDLRQEEKRRAL